MSNNQGLIIAGLAVALGFLGRGKVTDIIGGGIFERDGPTVTSESRSCTCYDGTRIMYKEGSCNDACAKDGHARPLQISEPKATTTCKVDDHTWESDTGNCLDECTTLGFCPEDTQKEYYTCNDGSRHEILGRSRQEICGCSEGYTLNNDGNCEKRTITETQTRYWLCPSGSQIIIPSGLTPAEESQIYTKQCGADLPLTEVPPLPRTPQHEESIIRGNLEYEEEFSMTPTIPTPRAEIFNGRSISIEDEYFN